MWRFSFGILMVFHCLHLFASCIYVCERSFLAYRAKFSQTYSKQMGHKVIREEEEKNLHSTVNMQSFVFLHVLLEPSWIFKHCECFFERFSQVISSCNGEKLPKHFWLILATKFGAYTCFMLKLFEAEKSTTFDASSEDSTK